MTKKQIDWDLVEGDCRADIKSLRQLSAELGVSHVMMSKKAKEVGWVKDLSAKIKAQAEAKVNKAAVNAEVNAAKLVTERQVVEAHAEVQFRIRMEHRQDIGRTRALFRTMLEELEVASSAEGRVLIELVAEALSPAKERESEEEQDRRVATMRRLLDKVTGGPARIDSAKKLTEMLEKLVKMEREAFGIAGEEKGTSEIDALLIRIGRGLS